MKYLTILLLAALMACNKTPIPEPDPGPISIQLLAAEPQGQAVRIRFRVFNSDRVAYYKVFSGDNATMLCVTGQIPNHPGITDYSYIDLHPNGDPTYYTLAYMTRDSCLTFDPTLFKVNH